MVVRASVAVVLIGIVAPIMPHARGEVTSEQVRVAVERAIGFLKGKQHSTNGNWQELTGYPGGVTALCTLALLNAGVDPNDGSIRNALSYLRKLDNPRMTYCTALQTMVFCTATPKKDRLLIRRNVAWIENTQIKQGPFNGAWSYSGNQDTKGDNSNSQFALLALYEAERKGIKVSETTWLRALDYWKSQQRDDGSWGYLRRVVKREDPSTGSMTCAGIAATVMASGQVTKGDARVEGNRVICCGKQEEFDTAGRGLDWLGRNFSVRRNPNRGIWLLYYLYGVERVGRLTGQRFLGEHDWYREGAEQFVSQQDQLSGFWKSTGRIENNPTIATALSLLFLSKGLRPVLISKLQHEPADDWNYHRSDLAHLTRYVESHWDQDMIWQVIDAKSARVQDLLQTPVLFISGRDQLSLTQPQKDRLREYINNGGFIFAEACCSGVGFDKDFLQLMKELFPENPLRLLPPDHPIWFAEEKVNPRYLRKLYGIDACCRTSVVYCPENLSCYWELDRGTRQKSYPPEIVEEIKACLAIGTNVLTYATNRELRDKLDVPEAIVNRSTSGEPTRATLQIAKVLHGGGSDDAPAALSNLLQLTRDYLQLPVETEKRFVRLTDAALPDYPILFMHGRRQFRFNDEQRQALRSFIDNGGFVFADAICAADAFARSFRREIENIFPEQSFERIPTDHPLFTDSFRGHNISQVTVRKPAIRETADAPLKSQLDSSAPFLEGIKTEGHYTVILSPLDLSCALENHMSVECPGYVREDAAKIGINIILYAMQQ